MVESVLFLYVGAFFQIYVYKCISVIGIVEVS